MISNAKELTRVVDEVIASRGFARGPTKGGRKAWYKHYPDTVLVLDLQKWDFGGRYFINLAIGARRLLQEEYPREELCHVRFRLDRILIDEEKGLLSALDLEDSSVSTKERELAVEVIVARGVEWLEQLTTEQALAERIRSDGSFSRRTYLVLKRHLGIECD
jgi:hypothetical protein